MKRKTYHIWTWKKHLFLDIFSTNIDTRVPSLYHCVKTRNREGSAPLAISRGPADRAFSAIFEPLERISRRSYELLYVTNTSDSKQETFVY
jgi:hypothetical protein